MVTSFTGLIAGTPAQHTSVDKIIYYDVKITNKYTLSIILIYYIIIMYIVTSYFKNTFQEEKRSTSVSK